MNFEQSANLISRGKCYAEIIGRTYNLDNIKLNKTQHVCYIIYL